ncbi:MAG: response regulator transcription factor, partial [Bacillota bacterium]
MIRVMVVDDHHMIRQGICQILSNNGDIHVVADTDSGANAIRMIHDLVPDVLVLDVSMPGMSGLDVLKEIIELQPKPKVVFLSIHSDLALVKQALMHGALGYVLKQSSSEELIDAIRAANRESVYLSSGVSHILLRHQFSKQPKNAIDRLSPREHEVTKLIVNGKTTKEIALVLHTSVKTVEKQRRDAMRKLDVDN